MRKRTHSRKAPLRLGFVALADCAPLIMAQELGIFAQHGLDVELHRELGWATVRDKIIYGQLDAAVAPAGLLVGINCGLGCAPVACVSGLVINLHGNAITLSQELWRSGVRDGATLRSELQRSGRAHVFGVVHQYSSHHILLRHWLLEHGIVPGRDVQIVVVPPAQLAANLKAGHLSGYCVGEPWNSLAVMQKTGWCVAITAELAPGHMEKVLMVRADFADRAHAEHLALIAALLEACAYCDEVVNREEIAAVLAQPQFVGVPINVLQNSLVGPFQLGNGRVSDADDFHVFSRNEANEPTQDRAEWLIDNLHRSGITRDHARVSIDRAAQWFRADLFQEATQLVNAGTHL